MKNFYYAKLKGIRNRKTNFKKIRIMKIELINNKLKYAININYILINIEINNYCKLILVSNRFKKIILYKYFYFLFQIVQN